MSTTKHICIIISLLIISSGCSTKNTQKTTVITKVDKKKKTQAIDKKVVNYKYCHKHIKIMKHAFTYASKEFKEGYFLQKDIVGAKAQLFLIENKSPTIFAKNINSAQKSYKLHYQLAKKNGCNVGNIGTSPLSKIKKTIKVLEKKAISNNSFTKNKGKK